MDTRMVITGEEEVVRIDTTTEAACSADVVNLRDSDLVLVVEAVAAVEEVAAGGVGAGGVVVGVVAEAMTVVVADLPQATGVVMVARIRVTGGDFSTKLSCRALRNVSNPTVKYSTQ
jgi:hypothetical protein